MSGDDGKATLMAVADEVRGHVSARPELSFIMPFALYDERALPLLESLKAACDGIPAEVLLIDGSADQRIAVACAALNTPAFAVRALQWPAETGATLTGAALHAGITAAQAPYISIIPPDFPHPPAQLIRLYDVAHVHDADIVMGSRYRPGSRPLGATNRVRVLFRRALGQIVRTIFSERLANIYDPLNNLMLIRRSLLEGSENWGAGYAPSLDALMRTPWRKLVEVPYGFEQPATITDAEDGAHLNLLMRQIGRLFITLPSAAVAWKITLFWLVGVVPALGILALSQLIGLPLWQAWVFAIEAQLFWVAFGSMLNADHRVRLDALIVRWVLGQWTFALPIALNGALTLLLAKPMHSALASFAFASLASLAAVRLLDTSESRREVLYTNAATSRDETVLFGQREARGQALTTLMMVAALVVSVASVAIEQLGPIVVVPTAIVGVAFILQYQVDRARTITVVLATASWVAAVDYAFWRIPMTNLSAWYIAIPLLIAELFGMAHMLGLQWSLWPRKPQRLLHNEDPAKRPIFIFIPTVNEGREILQETVRASLAARDYYLKRYPYGHVEIVLCNDGLVAQAKNYEEPIQLAKELGVACVTREVGGGAKAGNIEFVRRKVGAVGDALIVIFDADQVATPQFLVEIVAPFRDSNVGWVQSGQYYRNTKNPVARWADDQQALFYRLLSPGKEILNAMFMCGTNLMIRAAALDEIGGFPQDSVTEDFAASILLHSRWRSVYVPTVLAMGLGPMDLAAYFKQQNRWAIGTLSVLRTQWRRIFLPMRGGLSFPQRVQYALGCTHYFSGVRDLIYVVAPLTYVYFGVSAVRNGTVSLYLWHFLPYWVVSMSAFAYAAWRRTGWRGVVIGFASFPILVSAAVTVLTQRRAQFAVTAKRRQVGNTRLFVIIPHVIAWVASVVALIKNVGNGIFIHGAGFFVEVWLVYITLMLSFSLWLALHDGVLQVMEKLTPRELMRQQGGVAWQAWGVRLAPVVSGLALLSLLWGSLAFSPLGSALQSYTFAPLASHPVVPAATLLSAPPALGIAGQTDAIQHDGPLVESQLGVHFAIVGRTLNVADTFDTQWANSLSAHGAVPWITIQFGRMGANGQPTLDASLMAIANGTHDADLTRMAREIRAYGKPVLISILPYVDRDWSLNSAVANGAVPSDTPRAWAHVQAVFASVGATNAAWVWSPQDPAHDQPYTPPAASIDYVVVTMTYTTARFADDPAIIGEVAANHPGKRLLVEVTTVTRDAGEQDWLKQIAAQVSATPNIASLVYFDGLPGESTWNQSFIPDTVTIQALWRMLASASGAAPTATPTPQGAAS